MAGPIQSAINQASASIAGAVLGVKHVKEQELSNVQQAESQAIVAQGQAETATKEANEAYHAAKEPGGLIEKLIDADTALTSAKEAAASAKTPTEIHESRESVKAAQEAFNKLRDEYSAVEGMMKRSEIMRAHAEKMTGISEEKSARFARRWGGIK